LTAQRNKPRQFVYLISIYCLGKDFKIKHMVSELKSPQVVHGNKHSTAHGMSIESEEGSEGHDCYRIGSGGKV
jgi:hypothetical protein